MKGVRIAVGRGEVLNYTQFGLLWSFSTGGTWFLASNQTLGIGRVQEDLLRTP